MLLGDMPRLMSDVLSAAIAGHRAIEVLGRVDGRRAALERARALHADIVILAEPARGEEPIEATLAAEAPVAIAGIGRDGMAVALYELRPHRTALAEPSVDEIVRAIQQSVRHRGAPGHGGDAPAGDA